MYMILIICFLGAIFHLQKKKTLVHNDRYLSPLLFPLFQKMWGQSRPDPGCRT